MRFFYHTATAMTLYDWQKPAAYTLRGVLRTFELQFFRRFSITMQFTTWGKQ